MPYATVDTVRGLAPQIPITATSKPSDVEVVNWLTEQEATLNGVLVNLGYILPVHLLDVPTVRDKVAHKVLARVIRARTYGIGDIRTSGAAEADAVYDAWLKRLSDPAAVDTLPNTPHTGPGAVSKQGGLVRGFVPDDCDPCEAPRATMCKVF